MRVQFHEYRNIDFSTWNFHSTDKPLSKKNAKILKEIVEIAVEEGANISFDICGPEKVAPKIVVYLPFEAYKDQFEGPSFSIALEALVDEFVSSFEYMGREKADRVDALATKFRELANRVEAEARDTKNG